MVRLFLSILGLLAVTSTGWTQTCCSGGVPLSSNLGLPPAEAHSLQLSMRYDLNVLNTLKEGIIVIEDQRRNRKTHSILWQAGYSFSQRFSIDALFSFVRQERTIRNENNRDFDHTQGIGDAVLLLKYRLWENRAGSANWTVGLGTKLATGAADRTDDRNLLLNADLQPGSGATDMIFWTRYTLTGLIRPTMVFFATVTHNRRGANPDYLPVFDPMTGTERGQRYQFGNEWQLITGIGDRFLLGTVMLDPGLSLRLRSVRFDRINEQRLPGTGGTWWFANPNLTMWPGDQFSFNVNIEIPVYANIIGTQLSPTFRLNTGLFYRLSFRRQQSIPEPASIF